MTIGALNNAMSGLRVHQDLMDLASRNVSNVSTEGYSRKTIEVEQQFAFGQPLGVKTGEIARHVDRNLQRDLWRQIATAEFHSVRSGYLDQIQQLHGGPDSETSLAARLSQLGDSFNDLAADPSSGALQNEVIRRAELWAAQMNNVSNAIQKTRNDVQFAIANAVDEVNNALTSIAKLNRDIASLISSGRSAADLQDARDQHVQKVAEYMDVRSYVRGDGMLVLQTNTSKVLVEDYVNELSFNSRPLSYNNFHSAGFDIGVHLGGPGGPDLSADGIGGKIGALINLRDNDLTRQQAQLDELAHKTALRLEQQGLQLFVDDRIGDLQPFGSTPDSYAGIANNLRVEQMIVDNPRLVRDGFAPAGPPPHSAPAAAVGADLGDASLILNIVAHAFGAEEAPNIAHSMTFRTTGLGPAGAGYSTDLPADASVLEFARLLVGHQAGERRLSLERSESEGIYRDTLKRRQQDATSVDLDDEMAMMIRYQQAYSASARMVQTVRDMFTQLLNAT